MRSIPLSAYKGVIVPMVTPLDESGNIHSVYTEILINYLLNHATIPFIMGTTGEATLLASKEREDLVKILVTNRRENIPLIAGVIGLPYKDTIIESNKFFSLGIDSVVITLPNYFELTEKQMFNYYNDLSNQLEGNLILYNIPKTVHMSIPISVIDNLSYNKNIIGVKDSEVNDERLEESLDLWRDRKDFSHFTGANVAMVKGLSLGSKGIVPSTANFAPDLYTQLYSLCLQGKIDEANTILQETAELTLQYQKGRTLGESLAALKGILSDMELCSGFMMNPL
ncbi:MAG: dihydrodipicolinate synthase family protein [Bacteroidales bacterium]|nr:dihydrodipicolinate synthase family protein [Bacteroidales bacterium]MCF8391306.1 dihydrodipicolinate synthase family protein [Bacteroidales bacterium]